MACTVAPGTTAPELSDTNPLTVAYEVCPWAGKADNNMIVHNDSKNAAWDLIVESPDSCVDMCSAQWLYEWKAGISTTEVLRKGIAEIVMNAVDELLARKGRKP
jgi:hypothetical protein